MTTARPAPTDTGPAAPHRRVLSRRAATGLALFGVWSWIIWLTFLKNIWADDRSWDHGMTAFFGVHLVLIVVSLVFGTAIGWLGVRHLRSRA